MIITRYKLTIEYKGAGYAGWQRQPDQPSVQQAIEDAIEKFSGQKVGLTVAGRTDAGVHALGQVAHVDFAPFTKPMENFEIAKAINAHLRPQPVSVIKVEPVSDDFHARFSAIKKLYRYRIINRNAFLTIDQGLAWHIKKPLDVKAMQEAANVLVGHHDFTSFRDSECQAKNPFRTLDRLDVLKINDQDIHIEAQAQSFLHHQIRNMTGTLVMVGEGRWGPEDVKNALKAKDRAKGGPTAPPEGLYLVKIDY